MECVVITGGVREQREKMANHLRAHGYHYYSPHHFFMDDFGDEHYFADQQVEAERWCELHAELEIQHHHDLVVDEVMINPELMQQAREQGYRVVTINLDETAEQETLDKIKQLAAEHDVRHPSIFDRLARMFHIG